MCHRRTAARSIPRRRRELSAELKATPAVAGAGFKRAVLQSFRDVMAANMSLRIFINLIFASIIAFGVVYNAARVSLSERSRELASLRVLGFTRAEISLILMGELALLTVVGPAGRRALRVQSCGGDRRHRSTARSTASRCTCRAGRGMVVSRHHRRRGRLRTDRPATARSAGPGRGPQDPGVGRI